MKHTKFLSRILAISMLTATFATGLAGAYVTQPTASIFIENNVSTSGFSIAGKTYSVYRVFDATITDVVDDDDTITYSVNTEFYSFFDTALNNSSSSHDIAYDTEAMDYVNDFNNTDPKTMSTLVEELREYVLGTPGVTAVDQAEGTAEDKYTGELPAGYYLILDDDAVADTATTIGMLGSLPTRNADGDLIEDLTISLKGSMPTVNKEVWHNDIANTDGDNSVIYGTNGSWDVVADYQIGDIVDFRITATIPSDLTGYTDKTGANPYIYTLSDTLSEGLELDTSSLKIYTTPDLSGDAVTGDLHASETDIDNFKLTFDMYSIKAAFPDLKVFYLTYTATVTEDALVYNSVDELKDSNIITLTYSNNPYDSSSTGEDSSTVYSYTFDLDVTKTKGDSVTGLAGAKFALYEETSTPDGQVQTQIYLAETIKDSIPAYYPATGTVSDTAGIITTVNDGKFTIIGLDDATTYVLKEIEAPDGYNPANDVRFKINASYSGDDSSASSVTMDTTSSNIDDFDITIVNTSAALLPGTGGVGTTLFTFAGGAIMLGAVVLLITKRKKEASNN